MIYIYICIFTNMCIYIYQWYIYIYIYWYIHRLGIDPFGSMGWLSYFNKVVCSLICHNISNSVIIVISILADEIFQYSPCGYWSEYVSPQYRWVCRFVSNLDPIPSWVAWTMVHEEKMTQWLHKAMSLIFSCFRDLYAKGCWPLCSAMQTG